MKIWKADLKKEYQSFINPKMTMIGLTTSHGARLTRVKQEQFLMNLHKQLHVLGVIDICHVVLNCKESSKYAGFIEYDRVDIIPHLS